MVIAFGVPSIGVIDEFKDYSYPFGLCAKIFLRNNYPVNESRTDSFFRAELPITTDEGWRIHQSKCVNKKEK